jgi:hypothetical protein
MNVRMYWYLELVSVPGLDALSQYETYCGKTCHMTANSECSFENQVLIKLLKALREERNEVARADFTTLVYTRAFTAVGGWCGYAESQSHYRTTEYSD